jgi:hypothetical protein
MDYKEMSNEELYQPLLNRFPGAHFKEVADCNRQTVIAILKFFEDEGGG